MLRRLENRPGIPLLDDQPVLASMNRGLKAMHWPLAALCVLGALVSLRKRKELAVDRVDLHRLRPLGVAVLWFTLLYTLFLPDPRYLVPLRPLQFVLAIAAGTMLLQLPLRALRGRSRVVTATGVPSGGPLTPAPRATTRPATSSPGVNGGASFS